MRIQQKVINTPGGNLTIQLVTSPSNEVGLIDSEVSQLLLNPFGISVKLSRSPPRQTRSTNQQESKNAELRKQLNEKLTSRLSKDIRQLKKENEELISQYNISELLLTQYNHKSPFTGYDVEYHTVKKDLERVTEWILKKKKRPAKNRKADFSPKVEESQLVVLN